MKSHSFIPMLLTTALLTGCAVQNQPAYDPELVAWAAETQSMAKAGKVKWSDYYDQLFDRFRALPTSNSKVAMMGMAANMYDVAISYEAGKISKAEFDQALRRTAIAQEQLDANQMQAENDTAASGRASLGNALQQMGESMRQDAQRRAAPSYRSTTKCTTQYIYGKYETVCR